MNKTKVQLHKKIRVSLSLWVGFFLIATREMNGATPVPSAPQTTPTPATNSVMTEPIKPAPLYKSYVYYGDRYRDPFIPLNGDIRSDMTANERPPQVSSLALKGIVQDSKGRMALISSGLTSYILKGGRLYDGRNRMVKKIAGVIKTDSVVIIGSDRTVVELKTKAPL